MADSKFNSHRRQTETQTQYRHIKSDELLRNNTAGTIGDYSDNWFFNVINGTEACYDQRIQVGRDSCRAAGPETGTESAIIALKEKPLYF